MPRAVRTLNVAGHAAMGDDALLAAPEPLVVKGLARHWPLVRRGLESAEAALDYVQRFDSGRPVTAYVAGAETRGRFTYDAGLTAMGFTRERAALADCLDRLRAQAEAAAGPYLYLGSTDIESHLPGFASENPPPLASMLLDAHPPLASIWIGNRSIAPAHWDMSNNIAVCAVGRRRFTLFPPDQVANLYPGPLEPTPAGQVVSMVDFDAPDFARHPGFRAALAAAQVAELEPGDVLVYPALWWHQVEALDPVNMLVNYWWNAAGDFMDSPMVTILHGLLSLRDRPLAEKQAWRALFDYYLFGPAEAAAAHLPDHARGPLAPLDPAMARRLRAQVSARLQR